MTRRWLRAVGFLLITAAPSVGWPDGIDCENHWVDVSDDTERQLFAILDNAIEVNLWSLIDNYELYEGKYIDTFGYLTLFGGKVFLVPGKEYGDGFLSRYAVPISEACVSTFSVEVGSYVRVVASIMVCVNCSSVERFRFSDFVFLQQLSPALN